MYNGHINTIVSKYGKINNSQFGFQEKKFTFDAISNVADIVCNVFERGKCLKSS